MHLFDLLSILLRCNGFTGIQKAVVDQMGNRQPNSDHDLFLCKFCCGKCFWVSSQPNHSAVGPLLSYKVCFSLHVIIWSRNGLLALHKMRDNSWQWWFCFWFFSQFMRHSLLSFFTLSVCFKCQMTVEWLKLSSLATSHVVVTGSALIMLSTSCCQLPMVSYYTHHLQGSCLLCKTSWTTTTLYVG